MKRNNRHFVSVGVGMALALIVIGLLGKGLTYNPRAIPSPLVGKKAHAFSVKLLQGAETTPHASNVQISELLGSPLILNFWSSWCSSCQEESHVLEKFWREHKDSGVKMLGIAIHDDEESVRSMVQRVGKTYMIAIDEEGETALDFGVTGVPETVFIDRNGLIVHKETGPVTTSLLEEILKKLLNPKHQQQTVLE